MCYSVVSYRTPVVINANVGDQVIFPCSTNFSIPVSWFLKETQQSAEDTVYEGKVVYKSYRDRFGNNSMNTERGIYNLTMYRASINDNGSFLICSENAGQGVGDQRHAFKLIVTGNVNM